MALCPWSTSTAVHWRRTLRFYERRYEIMREIEDYFGISAYRHREDRIGVRLSDPACEIEISPNTLLLRARNPDADLSQLLTAATVVMKRMDHPRTSGGHLSMKHVVPLDGSFEDERARIMPLLFRPWMTRVNLTDTSIVYDATWEDRFCQVEFGVASADELAVRLPGKIGRLEPDGASRDEADMMPEPPEACLFVHSYWALHSQESAEPFEVSDVYAEVVTAGNEVVEALMDTINEVSA